MTPSEVLLKHSYQVCVCVLTLRLQLSWLYTVIENVLCDRHLQEQRLSSSGICANLLFILFPTFMFFSLPLPVEQIIQHLLEASVQQWCTTQELAICWKSLTADPLNAQWGETHGPCHGVQSADEAHSRGWGGSLIKHPQTDRTESGGWGEGEGVVWSPSSPPIALVMPDSPNTTCSESGQNSELHVAMSPTASMTDPEFASYPASDIHHWWYNAARYTSCFHGDGTRFHPAKMTS